MVVMSMGQKDGCDLKAVFLSRFENGVCIIVRINDRGLAASLVGDDIGKVRHIAEFKLGDGKIVHNARGTK